MINACHFSRCSKLIDGLKVAAFVGKYQPYMSHSSNFLKCFVTSSCGVLFFLACHYVPFKSNVKPFQFHLLSSPISLQTFMFDTIENRDHWVLNKSDKETHPFFLPSCNYKIVNFWFISLFFF